MSSEAENITEKPVRRAYSAEIFLILMGFVVFSPFSSVLVMDMFDIPISLPELLLIPFLYIFRKRYRFSSPGKIRSIIFLLAWLSMICVSILADNYSVFSILSSSRTYLLLIIAYLIFSKENNVTVEDIMYISLGSMIGWVFSSLYGINSFLEGDTIVISRTGNMLAIPLLIGISIYKKNYKVLTIGIIICILVSLTAGMRRQIAVFVVSLILSYVFLSFGNFKRFLKHSLILALFVIAFVYFLPQIESYVKDKIPVLYYRIFVKTQMFLSGDISHADSIRVNVIGNLANEVKGYLLPHGFVSRRTVEDGTGNFIDFPLSELLYMFGIFFTVMILSFFLFNSFCCYYFALRNKDDGIIYVIMSLVILMLLFLEGTFLSSTYIAPFTGYCLGRLKYYSRVSLYRQFEN